VRIVHLTLTHICDYKNKKYGKSVKFGRYVSKFRDKVLRIHKPARSVEPSIRVCLKTRHYVPEDNICHLMFMRLKFCQFFSSDNT
jgi:hypothetical protein